MSIATIPEALDDLRTGEMIVVVDDEDRENEGDLVLAAEKVTPEAINFMTLHGRGLICVALPAERLEALRIPMMTSSGTNTSRFETAFTVSVDARHGTTTGISAYDRAATVRALADPATNPEDLVMPGHIFPLRARDGGVLVRAGHTEAAVDLARLVGLSPAGVVCEILNEDGSMARLPQLETFAATHGLKIISIAGLIAHRRRHEKLVSCVAQAHLPTRHGEFAIQAYRHRPPPPGPGDGRRERRPPGAGPRSLRVPYRRGLWLPALRLRPPVGSGHGDHRRRGAWGRPLHAPGRARHRPVQQAASLCLAGAGIGHRGG